MTLEALRSELRSRLSIDPNGKIWTDAKLDDYINRAINYVYTRTNLKLQWEVGTITLVAGTSEYSPATNYRRIINAKSVRLTAPIGDKASIDIHTDTAWNFIENHDLDDTGDTPTAILEIENKFVVYPVPTAAMATDYSIQYRYSKYAPVLTEDSDEPSGLPSTWHWLLTVYAAYLALNRLPGKEGEAGKALADFEKDFTAMLWDLAYRQDATLTFRMPILPRARLK